MTSFQRPMHHLTVLTRILSTLIIDGLQYFLLCLRPSPALAAENLFLRKQLALYPRTRHQATAATPATRIALIWLGR